MASFTRRTKLSSTEIWILAAGACICAFAVILILSPKKPQDPVKTGMLMFQDLQEVARESQEEFNRERPDLESRAELKVFIRVVQDLSELDETFASQRGFEFMVRNVPEEELPHLNRIISRSLRRHSIPAVQVLPTFNYWLDENGEKTPMPRRSGSRSGDPYVIQAGG